jgi:hypothetical protein
MWKTGNNIHWIAITVFPDCLETFPQMGIYMIYRIQSNKTHVHAD